MSRTKKMLTGLGALVVSGAAGISTAFADTNPLSGLSNPSVSSSGGPGTGVYNFVMPQIVPLFLLFLGAMAVWYFVRHQHTKLVTLVIAATIVLMILVEPKAIGTLVGWVANLFSKL